MNASILWVLERLLPSVFRLPQLPLAELSDLLALLAPPASSAQPDHVAEPSTGTSGQSAEHDRLVAAVATAVWTLKRRMLNPQTRQPRPDMKRPYTTVRRLGEQLTEAGVETIEYENEPFDDGLAMDVLSWEPTEGVLEDHIIETSRPAVVWSGRRIQQAQVVVATPIRAQAARSGAERV